ncbi:hypothetical protein [Massilia sp. LjRoot122]|uniref:hypothetical protein n=1 Tax=Massilia sp. LjRoot122 TaxID=3342257 RepID=UPI003ED16408
MPQQAISPSKLRSSRNYDTGDLDDLLSIASTPRNTAQAPTAPVLAALPSVADSVASIEPLQPATRNDIFKRYIEFEEAISAAAAKMSGAENDVLGFALTTRPGTNGIEDLAKQAINMMIYNAKKQFSNQYNTLSIEVSEVLAATGQENWQKAFEQPPVRARRGINTPDDPLAPRRTGIPVDLEKIWAYLEKTYGGEAGQVALYKQLAPLLIRRLHLNDKDMRRTANAVIAYQNIRSEPASYGSKTGPYKLYERRDVNEVFDALSHVFEWSGLDALSLALKPERHKIGDYSFTFESREKFTFPGLEIVAFKDSLDWKFSKPAAEKLQLFLGQFGT